MQYNLVELLKNDAMRITSGFFFGLFQKNSSPKKLKLKEFSKKLKLKFQEKLKNPAIEVANIG